MSASNIIIELRSPLTPRTQFIARTTLAATAAFVLLAYFTRGVITVVSLPVIAAGCLISAGTLSTIVVGAVAGQMRDLREQARQERIVRELAEEEVAKKEHLYHTLVETTPDVIFELGVDGTIVSLNPAFEKTTGWTVADAIGRPFTWMLHSDDILKATEQLQDVVLRGLTPPLCELRLRSKAGEFLIAEFSAAPVIERGTIVGELGVARNVTDRTRAERMLKHVASFDALTDLPNLDLFADRLRQSMKQAWRHRRMLAVLFLDLDRFKSINETLGHKTGNAFLRAVAMRLSRCVREDDTIARFGGDEFIIQLSDMARPEDAALVAQKIHFAMLESFALDGHEIIITASIGISLYPSDGVDVDLLIKNAYAAMRQAKAQGSDYYRFYTPAMTAESLGKLRLEGDLRKALERDELVLHYQPLVSLASGRITGTEALVRWQHPEMGLLPPMDFIPLAESTGLIIPLGEWILKKVCMQAQEWQDANSPFRMTVNLSMKQFSTDALVKNVSHALDTSSLAPSRLELELTESMVMQNAQQTIAMMHDLRSTGIKLSLDDFGTGYSSLSYLQKLPLNKIKLDQSFVKTLAKGSTNEAISHAIITLAHSLDLEVIAEGVETFDQLELLRSLKCDEVQGFLFSRPVPAEEMTSVLAEERWGKRSFAVPRTLSKVA